MNLTRSQLLGTLAALGASALVAPGAAEAAPSLAPILNYPDWLSVRPTAASLAGKVVLVDVFTFACYNCKNITPNLRALHAQRNPAEFAIIGVHTPETAYERDRANVVTNLRELGIVWPVAIDNNGRLWRAYNIEYWPTQLIFDKSGALHTTIVGDSQDDAVDHAVTKLLA